MDNLSRYLIRSFRYYKRYNDYNIFIYDLSKTNYYILLYIKCLLYILYFLNIYRIVDIFVLRHRSQSGR